VLSIIGREDLDLREGTLAATRFEIFLTRTFEPLQLR
jgi:hypothetical protein